MVCKMDMGHIFYPSSGHRAVRSANGALHHVLASRVLVTGVYKLVGRGRKTPKSLARCVVSVCFVGEV